MDMTADPFGLPDMSPIPGHMGTPCRKVSPYVPCIRTFYEAVMISSAIPSLTRTVLRSLSCGLLRQQIQPLGYLDLAFGGSASGQIQPLPGSQPFPDPSGGFQQLRIRIARGQIAQLLCKTGNQAGRQNGIFHRMFETIRQRDDIGPHDPV